MTESEDSAAIHMFGAPDEETAVVVAQALTRFGFASVTVHSKVRLESPMTVEWEVTALDNGPYSDGQVGESAWATIYRCAIAIATRRGGWELGGTRCSPTALRQRLLEAAHIFEFDAHA